MPADKRATRLGVLAVVAALLFGAMGDPAVVPPDGAGRVAAADRRRPQDQDGAAGARARAHLRRLRAHPRRQPAGADDQRRLGRASARTPIGPSCSRGSPAGSASPSPTWRPASTPSSTAATSRCRSRRTSPRTWRWPSRSASRTSPASTIIETWKRVYPYAPLASHVLGYMGAITADDEQHYKDLGYDTSVDGETVGRAGVELSMEDRAARQVGRGHLRGRRQQPHRAPAELRGARSTARTSSSRSTCRCSSTPSGCCRPSSP